MALLTSAVTFSELPSARSMALINSFAQEDEVEEEDPEEVEDEVEEEDPEEVEDEVEEEDPEEVGRVEVFHVNSCPQNRELDDGFCCPENYHAGYELNPDRKKCVRNDLIIMDDTTTCPNGVVVPVTEDCPDDTTTCPNGAVVAADESCPDDTTTCPNGVVVPVTEDCPDDTTTCPNGAGWQRMRVVQMIRRHVLMVPWWQRMRVVQMIRRHVLMVPWWAADESCPDDTTTCPNGAVVQWMRVVQMIRRHVLMVPWWQRMRVVQMI